MYGFVNVQITAYVVEYFVYLTSKLSLSLFICLPKVRHIHIQRSRVRSPVLPDFLSSSGSGTGSTQPHEPREVN